MGYKSFSKTIKIRLVLQFLTTIATMSVTPYLIVFFSSLLGTVVTGFMFLGVMGASVIGQFTGGHLADRKGRKKMIVFSELFVFIGFMIVAFVNSPWFSLPYVTFILFLVIHFCSGMAGPAYQALIIDESNPDNRKSIYTFTYWFQNLAVAIGGITGAFLFMDFHFYLFIGVGLITLISLLITIFFIHDHFVIQEMDNTSLRPSNQNIFTSYLHVLKDKQFAIFALANLLIISVEEQLTNFIGIRLAKDIAEPEQLVPFLPFQVDGINMLGILKTENTILVVCLTVVISYLLRKLNERSILLSGLVIYFIGYIIISFSNIPSILLMAMLLATIGELMHIPIKQAMLANMVPDNKRGTYMAVFGLMAIFGASTAGIFIIISSAVPTFVLSILFAVMGLFTIFIFTFLTRKKKEALALPLEA